MKKGNLGVKPKGQKQAVVIEQVNGIYQLCPNWSFVKCDMEHKKWGISQNAHYLVDMLARFKEWERIKWGDILTSTSGRKSNTQSHPIPVERLSKEAKKRLEDLNLDEYDILYSLSITGQQRVWGIMIEETGTFQLLWYDPKHEIYKVKKR